MNSTNIVLRNYWKYYALAGTVFFPAMTYLQITEYNQRWGALFSLALGIFCLASAIRTWNKPYIVITETEIVIRDGLLHSRPTKTIPWASIAQLNRKKAHDLLISLTDGRLEEIPLFCMNDNTVRRLMTIILEHLKSKKGESE
ncbi:MAG: hypothetical protein JW884_05225 [Deltaproteobacteria bacterium]|nr:hypothetical protein [Deltaproteobacteria bacterium]